MGHLIVFTESESSVTSGTTETQQSGDYYGDSKNPDFIITQVNRYPNSEITYIHKCTSLQAANCLLQQSS